MQLLYDPQAWLSFLTLALLEIVLGIDNIIFLSILVERLPKVQRGSARILGLGFAMLTRIGLLFSITWLATLRKPLFAVLGTGVSGHNLILLGGGILLLVQSVMEIRGMLAGKGRGRRPGMMNKFLLIVLQIGILDIVFSLDSVFTAVGLSKHIEVMIAAIVVSVLVLMKKFLLIVLQIGILDIVFSLDSVFTAVGLSKHIEVMIAAIVVSVLVMM